jgi:hypothetical protein
MRPSQVYRELFKPAHQIDVNGICGEKLLADASACVVSSRREEMPPGKTIASLAMLRAGEYRAGNAIAIREWCQPIQ